MKKKKLWQAKYERKKQKQKQKEWYFFFFFLRNGYLLIKLTRKWEITQYKR